MTPFGHERLGNSRTGSWDRSAARRRLEEETWELVVVGGGVTGAGVARDAALRGLSVALVEAGDWAVGTSSRTTKFAHGGLRYLELLDFDLVRTALAERAVLLAIAPHLTRPTPFLIPARRPGLPPWKLRLGLGLYDALAGGGRLGRHRILGAAEARAVEPLLRADGLEGAGLYGDALVRDARLVVETVADAARAGATAVSYCAVGDVERWGEGWIGEVEDRRDGSRFTLRGRLWVNATGPWADRLRARAAPGRPALLEPTKGVHIVVPRELLPLRAPTAVPAPDGRLVFAVPEGPWTYIGTTDTPDGDVDDLRVDPSDVEYLAAVVRSAFEVDLEAREMAGGWAGWRPLVRTGSEEDPRAIPRDEVIEETAPGFLTVAGGKLTTYRRMAEETVDRVMAGLGRPKGLCRTDRRPLVPGSVGGTGPPAWAAPGQVARVRELFGPDADDVFVRWLEDPESAEPLGSGFPYGTAEVERASREMVETLEDLVDRRLSALPGGEPFDAATLTQVARAAAAVTGWDRARQEEEVAGFRSAV